MRDSDWTKILGWPGDRVFQQEIDERAKTLKLWVRRKAGNRKLVCSGCGRRVHDIHEVWSQLRGAITTLRASNVQLREFAHREKIRVQRLKEDLEVAAPLTDESTPAEIKERQVLMALATLAGLLLSTNLTLIPIRLRV